MANLTAKPRSSDVNAPEWVDQSPIVHVQGESYTHSLTWLGATTVTVSGVTIYRGTTDVTATNMPAGSHSASGNVATFKPLTALVGNTTLIIVFTCTVDGNTEIRKLRAEVKLPLAAQ
ncbi:hypothetical protein [Caudoviricetes sp.]|nr:hypothetical protein [Caudoviricetes sp.]UOF81094.1 hypothetical protein [Caudoviricetes sp.]UOF82225.1 hypothetical protein [Caudoviricetes sp.]UOF82439.1 hypothetical protein [Caudoviricetes sp.]UOF82638.1 hypothetical protein [Caudoviricetes sp.]